MYHTRHAFPPVEEGRTDADPTGVDVDDAETKRKIGAFNALVHKHRVCPAQTIPNDARRAKLAALQNEAAESLGVDDVGRFMKHTVWPFCKNGGDLSLGYAWEDNDPKHKQNREVCTHGVTLLDKEQLNPAECQPLPFPGLVQHRVASLRRRARARLVRDMDFLYANRYRQAKGGYIRFHHDQLTKMGPVVAGVSLGATAHTSYAADLHAGHEAPGTDGAVEVELEAGSLYVMAGISRYGLKHGVLDVAAPGDRAVTPARSPSPATPVRGAGGGTRRTSSGPPSSTPPPSVQLLPREAAEAGRLRTVGDADGSRGKKRRR
ncbi:phosphorelay sensor kinase [Aureococcus anophagefferens]|nr:phosphorelay sensor kinase [Aureococcus anophagefferens]